jgi:hypothetical protein
MLTQRYLLTYLWLGHPDPVNVDLQLHEAARALEAKGLLVSCPSRPPWETRIYALTTAGVEAARALQGGTP